MPPQKQVPKKANTGKAKFVGGVYSNTQSNLIEITEDKLINIGNRFAENIKRTFSWTAPVSIFLTLLLTYLTADVNKAFLGISKDVWAAIFILGMVLSFVWSIVGIVLAMMKYKSSRISWLVSEVKNDKPD